MSNKILTKFWPAIIITIVMFSFHFRLFLPQLSFYVTPDYGRSDALSLSLANKFYYSQELKKNRIPIWNPNIGTGYPALAEGQTAIFFLPNLFLFRLLPFSLAYNFTLVFSFILAGWGTYLFSRSLGLTKLTSVFAGTIFPLGGFFVFHVQHHNLLQAASLLPLLFWQIEEFLKTKKYKNLLYFSLILSQQYMAGFPQIVLYSLIAISIYLLAKHLLAEKRSPITYLVILFAILLGTLIAAIQIGPSYELLQNSSRNITPKQILDDFPYYPKNFLLFLDPFYLGSPKNSTYPHWIPGKWGIFWESQAYLGIIPIFLAAASLIFAFREKNKSTTKLVSIFGTLAIISLLISLGESSPTHILFTMPPLSFFRVPSRFLLLTQFSLLILAAFSLNKVKNKFIVCSIIILSISNIYIRLETYNPIEPSKNVLSNPQTAIFLKNEQVSNIFAIGNDEDWNNVFRVYGWENNLEFFKEARNALDQNSNLLYSQKQAFAYESILTKRYTLKNSILRSEVSLEDGNINFSTSAKNLINLYNASHIITTRTINDNDFELVFETTTKNAKYNVYKNKANFKKYYVANDFVVAKNIDQISTFFKKDRINPFETIVLEDYPGQIQKNNPEYKIQQISDSPTYQKFNLSTTDSTIFIVNESYYPGWIAKIDNKSAKIFAANINSRAVLVPEGDHVVEFLYKSKIIYLSATISTVSLLFALLIMLKVRNRNLKI